MSLKPEGGGGGGAAGGFKKKMTIRSAAAKQKKVMHEVDFGAPCLTDPNCPGFELHFWRKQCKHCHRPREEHAVDWVPGQNRPVARIIMDKTTEAEEAARRAAEEAALAKDAPPPEPPEPPRVRSMEERTKLAHQDPEHDHNPDACSSLTSEGQINSFNRLNDRRNEMYGVGEPKKYDPAVDDKDGHNHCCHRTDTPLKKGDDVVFAPNLNDGNGAFFLADHFTCFCCGAPLLEYNYYEYENEVYCGRCHAEKFMPRCAGCDELIFDPTYTVAENKKWHIVHFCCWVCDVDLCEKKYAKDPEDNPVCLPCFNDKYAVQCGTCKNVITAGQRAMKAGDQSYCDSKSCFSCTKCKTYLGDQKVVQFQGDLYCSPCYKQVHSPPCAACGEQIHGEFVEVKGKRHHKACFKCAECSVPFTREEKKGAYPIGDRLLCYTHALAARRAELKAAKAAKAAAAREEQARADKEREAAAAALAAETAAAAAAPPPAVTVTEEPELENVEATSGGAAVEATQNTQNWVRQGTKRVSRMTRKPSVKPKNMSANEKAAMEKAVKEAEAEVLVENEGGAGADAGDDQIDLSIVAPRNMVSAAAPAGGAGAAAAAGGEGVHSKRKLSAEAAARRKSGAADPYAAMWAGFSIPMKLSKFQMEVPGREVLEVGQFTMIEKKFMAKVFVVLCTDVALVCQKVDDDCYELMFMPVERDRVKARIVNVKKLPGVACMKVKIGKTLTLKCKDEIERSTWIGRLNAPIGFVPTKLMMARAT